MALCVLTVQYRLFLVRYCYVFFEAQQVKKDFSFTLICTSVSIIDCDQLYVSRIAPLNDSGFAW